MKRLLIGLSVVLNTLFIGGSIALWANLDNFIDSFLQSNRDRLESQFELFTAQPAQVVFLGDSITQGGRWSELFPGTGAVNRGIGGDTTQDVLNRLEQIYPLQPQQLFIMIGINDLNRGFGPEVAIANYTTLFNNIDEKLPQTRVYLQSVLPVNDTWPNADNTNVPTLNTVLAKEAQTRGYTFVDLTPAFSASDGQLRAELSNDGIHLLGAGYAVWQEQIQALVGTLVEPLLEPLAGP
jgi:lysophospholipase L1-like esterase